jgi:hypothetical protein
MMMGVDSPKDMSKDDQREMVVAWGQAKALMAAA